MLPCQGCLLDSWHPFSAQRKDVLPSNLLGPGAPSASAYQCFLLKVTLRPAAFPCTPSLVSWGRQQLASTWQPSAFPQHWVNTRTYQSLLPAAADIPIPDWGFKGCLPEPSNLLSCLLLGSGTGLDVWGKHDFAVTELQQLWITRAGKSKASCSISAFPLRDVCECFWPATQLLCCHPTEYLPAQKEASSVLFLGGISHLPLKHMPDLSLASSPLRSAPHQQGEEACGYCPGRQHTQALNLGLAAGSAPGSFFLCSSTEPSWHPEGCISALPAMQPLASLLRSARHRPTAPITVPHPSQAFG